MRRTGQMDVPVTAIGGEMVVGFDRPRLESIIRRLQARATAPRRATLGAAVKDGPGDNRKVSASLSPPLFS